MNFIPEPRQRNDIAPLAFLAFACLRVSPFFGKAFHWMAIPKKVMCAILKLFADPAPVKLSIEKVVCAIIYAFMDWVLIAEKVMCTVGDALSLNSPVKLSIEKVVCTIFNALAGVFSGSFAIVSVASVASVIAPLASVEQADKKLFTGVD